jgi:hypothetical protein
MLSREQPMPSPDQAPFPAPERLAPLLRVPTADRGPRRAAMPPPDLRRTRTGGRLRRGSTGFPVATRACSSESSLGAMCAPTLLASAPCSHRPATHSAGDPQARERRSDPARASGRAAASHTPDHAPRRRLAAGLAGAFVALAGRRFRDPLGGPQRCGGFGRNRGLGVWLRPST